VPPNLVIDLALGGGSFDGLNNLWVTISNNGPDAYSGTIKVSCTTWYTDIDPLPLGLLRDHNGVRKTRQVFLLPRNDSPADSTIMRPMAT